MIPVSDLVSDPQGLSPGWQQQLRTLVRSAQELLRLLDLDQNPELLKQALAAEKLFPVRVTHSYLERIQPGCVDDPLLKQVLPLGAECENAAGYVTDPLQEFTSVTPGNLDKQAGGFATELGLVQKYPGRVLVIATGACAIHCRYCFRRHFPYQDYSSQPAKLDRLLAAINEDTSIEEVIFSGGDPLMWSTDKLRQCTERFGKHVRRVRIHSRLPIVLPDRLDADFCHWWQQLPQQKVMVIHGNHPAEFSDQVLNSLRKLNENGCTTLLNQAVLLKGVNDSVAVLKSLFERGFQAGVLPYYLHLLDPVQGAAHFDVPRAEGKALIQQLSDCLPGYLVPNLVQEIPGEMSKTRLL